MTPDAGATSWRDIADLLTPHQVAELEHMEREEIPPGLAQPHHHLNHARKMAELNIVTLIFADLTPPADAIGEVGEWTDIGDDEYQRSFISWRCPVGDASVEIYGLQYHDGRVERFVLDTARDCTMTAEQARQRSAALRDAADELDRIEARP